MNSSEGLATYYKTLEACLGGSLISIGWHMNRLAEPDPGLLLVTGELDVAGFVVAGQKEPRATYEQLYGTFKDLYRIHVDEWESRTLSFVCCPVAMRDEDMAFWNSVEVNTYFCRKFVIEADNDPDRLQQRLLRLPFIPLDRQGTVSLGRPRAAQDLLRASGVEPDLADKLVSIRSSDQGIASSCLSKDPITLESTKTRERAQPEEITIPVAGKRIDSLDVSEFRAYRGHHQFDLSADVTVLYGPNGLGKTSLFDAIDFVCTGRLGRFTAQFGPGPSPVDLIQHLDATAEAEVRMTVSDSTDKHTTVTRTTERWDKADVDGARFDRKRLLKWLGCGQDSEATERVENLERLFRSCHLFGQDYQALLTKFRNTSQLEPDIVARMLALEDYVRGSRKAGQVARVIQMREEELSGKRRQFNEDADLLRKRREIIRASLNGAEAPEAIQKTVQTIVQKVRTAAGVKIRIPDTVSDEHIREWRTEAAGADTRLRALVGELNQLESELPGALVMKSTLPGIQEHVAAVRAQISTLSRDRKDLTKGEAELRQRYDEILARIERSRKEREGLVWLANVTGRVTAMETSAIQLTSALQAERARLDDTRKSLSETTRARLEIQEGLGTNAEFLSQARTRWATIRDVVEMMTGWMRWRIELARSETMLRELERRIEENANQHRSLSDQLNATHLVAKEAEKKSREISSSHAKLAALLGQLTEFISDATCPTCGSDLGTRDRLLDAITARSAAVPVEQKAAAEREERIKQEIAALAEREHVLAEEARQLGLEGRAAREERDKLQALLAEFEGRVRALNLPTDPSQLGDAAQLRMREEEQEIQLLEAKATGLQRKLDAMQHTLSSSELSLATLVSSIGGTEEQLAQTRQEIQSLRDEAKRQDLLLPADAMEVATRVTALDETLSHVEKQAKEIQAKLKDQGSKGGELGESLLRSQSEQADLEQQETAIKEHLIRYNSIIVKCSLPAEPTLEQIGDSRDDAMKRLEVCESVESELNALEQMLKIAAQLSELSSLEKEQQVRDNELRDFHDKLSHCRRWRKYFREIGSSLNQTRSDAVDAYTTNLGPMVSVLQQRLRPVYGFGKVRIQSSEGNLRALVTKGGKEFLPTNYFSESQEQVLMLSLFLAIASTQTWSSFTPVLLDDPVTHFDDLNAYAFVELIRGLLMSHSSVRRQFIISTCDERLYRIMRQKFGTLEPRAGFYEFRSIGSNGPVYKHIEP